MRFQLGPSAERSDGEMVWESPRGTTAISWGGIPGFAFKVVVDGVEEFNSAEQLLETVGIDGTLGYRGVANVQEGVDYMNSLYKRPKKPGTKWYVYWVTPL